MLEHLHGPTIKFIPFAFRLSGCSFRGHHHHNAIEHGGACIPRRRTLANSAKNVHPSSRFRFLRRWLSAHSELPQPLISIMANTRAGPCATRLPRSRAVLICCCFVVTLPITDFPKKRKNSSPIFALP